MKCRLILSLLCLMPVSLANAYDDTTQQFDIYQKISTVLRNKGSSEDIENLRAAMEDQAADVYESIGIINWQLQAAGFRCKDHPVPLIVNSLGASPDLVGQAV